MDPSNIEYQKAKELFNRLYEHRDENFGNARDVRNLFEQAIARQSDRVAHMEAPTREDLMELRMDDLIESEERSNTMEEKPNKTEK